jgi:peroxiredoxin
VAQYGKFGIDVEAASGDTHHELPVPAVFVLGTDGKIRFEYVNLDYKSRLDPDVLLAMAKAALKK